MHTGGKLTDECLFSLVTCGAWRNLVPGANKLTTCTSKVSDAAGRVWLHWLRLLEAAIGLDGQHLQEAASRLVAPATGCCCCPSRQAGCSPVTRKVDQVPGVVYDKVVDVLRLACMHDKHVFAEAKPAVLLGEAGHQHKRCGLIHCMEAAAELGVRLSPGRQACLSTDQPQGLQSRCRFITIQLTWRF